MEFAEKCREIFIPASEVSSERHFFIFCEKWRE